MEIRQFGMTDLEVSRLGAGLSEIGFELTMEDVAEAGSVLNHALDGGITFLDTSACYGISEELIGRTIAHRRQEFVLATKCGHVTGGYQGAEWTAQTVTDSIDRSLRRMKTDFLDLVQLHSCGVDILERGEVIKALSDAKTDGKTRYIGYSGDNEAALWAVESGRFDALQTSFNLVDQGARTHLLPQARAKGMGIIVKRPIANGAWGAPKSPSAYADQYFRRAQDMQAAGPLPDTPEDRIMLALGFTLAHDEVDTAIVGTRNPEHMLANIRMVEEGISISQQTLEALYQCFDDASRNWAQLG
jgi:aryl-alcohol dehydrogenase-like predicted oxidoreductase